MGKIVGAGKFDSLAVVPLVIAGIGMASIPIFLPKKGGAFFGIVSLHKIRVNAQFPLRNAAAPAQGMVDFILRDEVPPCRGKVRVCGKPLRWEEQVVYLLQQFSGGGGRPEAQQFPVLFIFVCKQGQLPHNRLTGWKPLQFLFDVGGTVRESAVQRTDGWKKAALLCLVAEILAQIPQLFGQLLELIIPRPVNYLLTGKLSLPKQEGYLRRRIHPGNQCASGNAGAFARRNPKPFFIEPQGIFLSSDPQALAAHAKFLFQKGRSCGAGRIFLKEGHNTLQTAGAVAAAGQGAANNRLRHRLRRTGKRPIHPASRLFPFLRPDNRLHLFLRGRKEAELLVGRFGGQKNSGFFTRRLDFLIYL